MTNTYLRAASLAEFLSILDENGERGIILYGTGNVGQAVARFLVRRGIAKQQNRFLRFAVSKATEDIPSVINGTACREIAEYANEDKA